MLVLRSGSVSRTPMVDKRTALGTVTVVSGEQPSQDRSGSNLELLTEISGTNRTTNMAPTRIGH